jgi:hypothetical protein
MRAFLLAGTFLNDFQRFEALRFAAGLLSIVRLHQAGWRPGNKNVHKVCS